MKNLKGLLLLFTAILMGGVTFAQNGKTVEYNTYINRTSINPCNPEDKLIGGMEEIRIIRWGEYRVQTYSTTTFTGENTGKTYTMIIRYHYRIDNNYVGGGSENEVDVRELYCEGELIAEYKSQIHLTVNRGEAPWLEFTHDDSWNCLK